MKVRERFTEELVAALLAVHVLSSDHIKEWHQSFQIEDGIPSPDGGAAGDLHLFDRHQPVSLLAIA